MKVSTRTLGRLVKKVRRGFYTNSSLKSDSSYNKTGTSNQNRDDIKKKKFMPPEPTECCMTGCPNCVWIKYAQELAELYEDGDVLAKEKINEKVKDKKLKAFLFAQLGIKEAETRR